MPCFYLREICNKQCSTSDDEISSIRSSVASNIALKKKGIQNINIASQSHVENSQKSPRRISYIPGTLKHAVMVHRADSNSSLQKSSINFEISAPIRESTLSRFSMGQWLSKSRSNNRLSTLFKSSQYENNGHDSRSSK